jgi:tetratricopeptide (TPR) repeat protein
MKSLILFLGILLSATATWANTAQQALALWQSGNSAYQHKQFDSAIQNYEQALGLAPQSASIHYNLGNAYFRQNKLGSAMLHYQKSLLLDPNNQNTKDNITLVNARIPNGIKTIPDIFFIRWWHTLTSGITSNRWAMSSLLLFWLYIIFLWQHVQTKKHNYIPKAVWLITPILNVLFISLAILAAYNKNNNKLAVVIQQNAACTTKPNVYQGQSLIPEGTTVQVGAQKANWIYVTLPNHKEGWMQLHALGFVQPTK